MLEQVLHCTYNNTCTRTIHVKYRVLQCLYIAARIQPTTTCSTRLAVPVLKVLKSPQTQSPPKNTVINTTTQNLLFITQLNQLRCSFIWWQVHRYYTRSRYMTAFDHHKLSLYYRYISINIQQTLVQPTTLSLVHLELENALINNELQKK